MNKEGTARFVKKKKKLFCYYYGKNIFFVTGETFCAYIGSLKYLPNIYLLLCIPVAPTNKILNTR